jgi:hypothetical protein
VRHGSARFSTARHGSLRHVAARCGTPRNGARRRNGERRVVGRGGATRGGVAGRGGHTSAQSVPMLPVEASVFASAGLDGGTIVDTVRRSSDQCTAETLAIIVYRLCYNRRTIENPPFHGIQTGCLSRGSWNPKREHSLVPSPTNMHAYLGGALGGASRI